MKQKKFIQKFRLFLIIGISIFLGQQGFSADIVKYTLDTNNASTGGLAVNNPGGVLTISSNLVQNGINPLNTSGWYVPLQYYELSAFNTVGYHTITVSAFMSSDADGPLHFKMQYNIGAGWNDASPITITTVDNVYTVILPDVCTNKSSVQIRWINTDNISATGTVSNSGQNFIYNISVVGSLPTRPATNASDITFVSITPTTIDIAATPGEGSNRIIVIKYNDNNFTLPTDDQIFTANPDYTAENGGNQQVIYNGTGSTVRVTVPNSTRPYWVRIFNYNYNAGMTRYVTDVMTNNPKLCALPTITADAATLIRLTTATIGATISSSPTAVNARGTVWKYTNPGVISTNNKTIIGSGSGSFEKALSVLTRGSRIYFKGWATNFSGTIYSNELYFENIPIFTGTGNWEDNTKWNVQQVPGSAGTGGFGNVLDKPIIDGNCTVNTSNSVTNLIINNGRNLTINTGTINTGNILNVIGTLANNSTASGILIKSDKDLANGSLIWATGSPQGTVEMWSKSYSDTRYHWQYFGIPVTGINANVPFSGTGVRVRKYNEANIHPVGPNQEDVGLWLPSAPGASMATTNDAMNPVVGYEVTQLSANKFTFSGTLNHNDVLNYALGYTTGADWQGNNIIANPFTGAIKIANITSINTDGNVYIYNTGSRDEWTGNSGATLDGLSPGQYTASNGTFAGNLGTPSEIPSMQGFLVKATGSGANISIPYSSVIPNTTAQRAPQAKETAIVGTRIDVTGSNHSDKMWIFTSDNCTKKFDWGYDAVKILGYTSTPQLFATEAEGDYQIDAVNDMNNTLLSFQPGSETNLKLKFTHQNIESKYSSIFLVDLLENKPIDVTASGAEYAFTAVSSSLPTPRFKIITTPLNPTGINTQIQNTKIKVFNIEGCILVQNFTGKSGNVVLYNIAGKVVRNVVLNADGITTISNLNSGIYLAKATADSENVTERLIIR